jgi:tRNA pseudouridine55 synthase
MDGIIIIDKPAGLTSHDVVARARRILRTKRVGHTGTLDPFATGVLVVLLGRATRLAQFLSGAEKEYEAVVRLGYATDTGDATGTRREEKVQNTNSEISHRTSWTIDEIEAALAALRGEIEQVPPMYSAKKVGGQKLYELARRGEEIERKAARVTIHKLELMDQDAEGAPLIYSEAGTCDLRLNVACSAGTYVRVLAEEIGARLGTPAHLSALRRTRAGSFTIASAVTLDQLELMDPLVERAGFLISTEAALPELPALHLTSEEARRALNGVGVRVSAETSAEWQEGERVRMLSGEAGLIAIGVYDAVERSLRPRVVIGGGK